MAFSIGGVVGMNSGIHVRLVQIKGHFMTVDDKHAARLLWCFE